MDPDAVEQLARTLMQRFGLKGWTFSFNRAKRNLGICIYEVKRIELSIYFIRANDEAAIKETILHEIAHALAGKKAGHGLRWKTMCKHVGAIPQRCDAKATMPTGRWRATCPCCDREYSRHQRPSETGVYACRTCGREKGLLKFAINQAPQPSVKSL